MPYVIGLHASLLKVGVTQSMKSDIMTVVCFV